jgi:tetratricopeptide (TPR) repeat protein
MSHYTRGLALGAKGKPDESAQELAALRRLMEAPDAKSLDGPHLPGFALMRIAEHDLAGQLALRKGDHAEAIIQLTKAVALEDELPYMEPPFSYMPMRHGLGAALLVAGRAKDAEQVYREDLKRFPNNGWSLFGLSQALRTGGKADAADEVRRQFEQAWIRADVTITSSRM